MLDVVNPYIAGNPVTGTAMFFGREDVFQFIRQALIGQYRDNVIVLYGQRRSGKTSVLYQMRTYLHERYLCVFMDMHGFALEGLKGLLWEMANHILRTLRRDYQLQLPPLERSMFFADPRSYFENEFLHQLKASLEGRHILLMLDEVVYLQEQVQAGKLEHEVFEYVRYLMQHYEWLNFLFSLGSGLEELEKEYAYLFNVGLYKKISFLDKDSTYALITQPVTEYYRVEPAALAHIYDITRGHPYFTQLLCHSLFSLWQRQQVASINVEAVNEVLNEAVEHGSAVLKYAWEELTVGEKAVVAGMAAAMGKNRTEVSLNDIQRVWQRSNIYFPDREITKALRSLLARDVIVGHEKFAFAVDLQRLWIQRYRCIEWTKEEIADLALQEHRVIRLPLPTHFPLTRLFIIAIVVLLIGGGSGLLYVNSYLPNVEHASATATAYAINTRTSKSNAAATATVVLSDTVAALHPLYPSQGAQLVLDDPLRDNSRGANWDENGNCQFPGDGYRVATAVQAFTFWCVANATNFSNFVYEVRMTILKGDAGGLIFRANTTNSKVYDFEINQNGAFQFLIYTSSENNVIGESGQIPGFHQGDNQSNLIAVMAKGDRITFFANYHYITAVTYYSFSQGQIGLLASEDKKPTQVSFTDLKVWKL